ncbi:MAG: 16S rRNA (guanine(527)-N(7))-methyltransferase RsmG [Vampirovibrionales bacterium]
MQVFHALLPLWWQVRRECHPRLQAINPTQEATLLKALSAFYEALCAFNAHTNVTRITEPLDFLERHVWESWWGVLPRIVAWETKRSTFPSQIPSLRYLDIGAGGGIPLIPMALLLQACEVPHEGLGVDTVAKKVACMQEIVKTLALPSVTVLHARVERLGHLAEHRHHYHWVTARAVAHLTILLEVGIPLLSLPEAPTSLPGELLCWKGSSIQEEYEQSHRMMKLLAVEALPSLEGDTRLTWKTLLEHPAIEREVSQGSLKHFLQDHALALHEHSFDVAHTEIPSVLLSVYRFTTRHLSPKGYPRKEGKPFQKPLFS